MSKYINSERFRNLLQKEVDYWKEKAAEHYSVESESRWSEAKHILDLFDSLLQEEESRPSVVERLRAHLANTPKEQLEAEWKSLEKWNDVGPTVDEYSEFMRGVKKSEYDVDDYIIFEGYIYKITGKETLPNGIHYGVRIAQTDYDPEEVVTGIGPAGAERMRKITVVEL